jgi:hypothetical protein
MRVQPPQIAEGTGLFGGHSIQPLLTDGSVLHLSTIAVLCILQKPQYRTPRHYLPAQDRQVAICDKAMQHKHPLIPLPFAESTMVTRLSLLNCLFCHRRITLLEPGPTVEPPHGKALRAHIMLQARITERKVCSHLAISHQISTAVHRGQSRPCGLHATFLHVSLARTRHALLPEHLQRF